MTTGNGLAIEARNLEKRFGKDRALEGLNLEVPTGSIYGLLGENGAGKTTTIRLAMGLLKPTSGEISVLGFNPFRDAVAMKREIGYLPEARTLYPQMTITEILEFVGYFYSTWDRSLVGDLRERLGLTSEKRIASLSRGMYAKLALIMALGHRPKLLILDEPSHGLDPLVRREFLEILVAVIAEEGRTVLFSSHLVDEVERVSDRIGIMRGGRLVVEGDKDTLLEGTKRVRMPADSTHGFGNRVVRSETVGREVIHTIRDWSDGDARRLAPHHEVIDLDLEDYFFEVMR